MRIYINRLGQSLTYAGHGIQQALRHEANMRVHIACALLAIAAGLVLRILPYEWLILTLTITLVLFAELINTALEAYVDLVTRQRQAQARIAKDVAAGAVLVTSVNAVITGLIIFAPKLWECLAG